MCWCAVKKLLNQLTRVVPDIVLADPGCPGYRTVKWWLLSLWRSCSLLIVKITSGDWCGQETSRGNQCQAAGVPREVPPQVSTEEPQQERPQQLPDDVTNPVRWQPCIVPCLCHDITLPTASVPRCIGDNETRLCSHCVLWWTQCNRSPTSASTPLERSISTYLWVLKWAVLPGNKYV